MRTLADRMELTKLVEHRGQHSTSRVISFYLSVKRGVKALITRLDRTPTKATEVKIGKFFLIWYDSISKVTSPFLFDIPLILCFSIYRVWWLRCGVAMYPLAWRAHIYPIIWCSGEIFSSFSIDAFIAWESRVILLFLDERNKSSNRSYTTAIDKVRVFSADIISCRQRIYNTSELEASLFTFISTNLNLLNVVYYFASNRPAGDLSLL